MKHPVKHLRFPKAAIEAIAKFRQVPGQILRTDAMMDAPDVAFNIGKKGVDPRQDLWRLFPRARYQPLMMEAGRGIHKAIALPAIGLDHHLSRQAFPHQVLNLFAADSGYHPHGGKPGLIDRGFHSY